MRAAWHMALLFYGVTALWLVGAVLLHAVPVHAAQIQLDCPKSMAQGQAFTVTVTAVSPTPVGAYSVILTFDPHRVTVGSIAGGGAPFANAPTSRGQMGQLALAGLQSSTLTGPTGTVPLAKIGFTVVGVGDVLLNFDNAMLFATDGTMMPVSSVGCTIVVDGGMTTTTTLRHRRGNPKRHQGATIK